MSPTSVSQASLAAQSAPRVTIAIPAKDEEAVIEDTLRRLPLTTLRAAGLQVEVVVLDGQSTDRTAAIARAWGATVLTDRGTGKGAALRHARHAFRGEYVVMLDADGTYAPDAIPLVLGPLLARETDIVMGRRVARPGAMKPAHRAGNRLLSLEASALYLRTCPDLCTGLWGFRADVLRSLPLQSRGFELEAEIFALASRLGHRIVDIRVDYLPRRGQSKLSSVRDGWRIAWWLVRMRFAAVRAMTREPTKEPNPIHEAIP